MEKVETKTFIKGKEVFLVADKFGTKIYQDGDTYYVVNLDDLVAKFDLSSYENDYTPIVNIEDNCRANF